MLNNTKSGIKITGVTVFLVILSLAANAKNNVILGHYWVDAPSEVYQFTSLSIGHSEQTYKMKLVLPFIQREAYSNGWGNPLLKLSKHWTDASGQHQLTVHIKQKFALANEETTTAVNDTAFALEYSPVFHWGIPFIEAGYWWRESVSYTRKDSFYGSLGLIKPFKSYVIAAILDNKPTALGSEDSMASIFVRKKLSAQLSIACLYGEGLSSNSPNHSFGLQVNRAF